MYVTKTITVSKRILQTYEDYISKSIYDIVYNYLFDKRYKDAHIHNLEEDKDNKKYIIEITYTPKERKLAKDILIKRRMNKIIKNIRD